MNLNYVASFAQADGLRSTVQRLQSELNKAQTELSTGKVSDLGLALGGRAGNVAGFQQQQDHMQGFMDTNSLLSTQLDTFQNSATNLLGDAQEMVNQLISNRNAANGANQSQTQASGKLQSLISTLNLSMGGDYVFGGINTGVKPMADYPGSPANPAKLAVDAAFTAAFGMAPGSAAASGISASAMSSFLDTQFSALFDQTHFAGTWSAASDTVRISEISAGQHVDSSVSANDPAMRKLAMAYTMLSDLGVDKLNADAFQTVMDKATQVLGSAKKGMIDIQTQLGITQSLVEKTNTRLGLQKSMLTTAIGNLQDVDPYEATTRVNNLTTQIETTYSMTSRLSQLSLLKYL